MSETLRPLLRLAPARRSRFMAAAALGGLTVLFGVGLMATAGYLISRAAQRPTVVSLMVAIVGVRFFGLGRPVVRYLERLASHDLALRVLGGVRTRFYARIEPLAPAQLSCYREGDLLSRMVADVDALQNLYLRGLGPPVVALLAGAVSVGVAAAVLPAAGMLLAVGLLVAGLAIPALSGFLSRQAGSRVARGRGALSAELVELLIGAPELIAFGGERAALERVRAADRALVSLARRDALASGIGDALGLVVSGATVCGVLAVAVGASAGGHLDPVLIAMVTLLALASFEAVTALTGAAREQSATLAAGRRIMDLTDVDALIREPADPAPPPAWPFSVALEDVRARYPRQQRDALHRVSLRLDPGEHVALVGPSGAGKTTVTNLLLRFLDPQQGRLTIDGRDLRDYRLSDIRRAISVAGQESHLFSASIRENVRLGRSGAPDAEIEHALRRAQIWNWVQRLPDGLDTFVGERGRELSGGQRQRIVLARAMLAESHVLVLDEPTAHLDPSTAHGLMRDVFAATRDCTVLLITHRSEGLEFADRVLSLSENGVLVSDAAEPGRRGAD